MLFTAKLASVLLAVAASAQASVVARAPLAELSVVFYDDTEFRGASFSPNPIHPATCIDLPDDWVDKAQSVRITKGYNCHFFVDGKCEGSDTLLTGDVSSLPDPPLYDNIESFFCTKA